MIVTYLSSSVRKRLWNAVVWISGKHWGILMKTWIIWSNLMRSILVWRIIKLLYNLSRNLGKINKLWTNLRLLLKPLLLIPSLSRPNWFCNNLVQKRPTWYLKLMIQIAMVIWPFTRLKECLLIPSAMSLTQMWGGSLSN